VKLQATLIAAALLLFTNPCWADIYKWVDENGLAHFTDDPAQVPKPSRAAKPRNKTTAQYESALNNIWDVMDEEKTPMALEDEIREESVGEFVEFKRR